MRAPIHSPGSCSTKIRLRAPALRAVRGENSSEHSCPRPRPTTIARPLSERSAASHRRGLSQDSGDVQVAQAYPQLVKVNGMREGHDNHGRPRGRSPLVTSAAYSSERGVARCCQPLAARSAKRVGSACPLQNSSRHGVAYPTLTPCTRLQSSVPDSNPQLQSAHFNHTESIRRRLCA